MNSLFDCATKSEIYVEIVERAREVLGDAYVAEPPKVPTKERLSAKEVHAIWGRLDEIAPSQATGSEIGITLLPTPPILEFMRHAARTRGDVLGGMLCYARLWGLLASTNQLEVSAPSATNAVFKICPVFGPGRRSRIAAQVTLGAVVCGMRAMSTRPIVVKEVHLAGSLNAEARQKVLKHIQRLIPAPNLKEVAKIMGLSERSLQRQLNNEGLTFRELARQGRLYLARSFLRSGCTVTQSAVLAGYSDISSFTRAYKARYHCTPGRDFQKTKGRVRK